MKVVDGETYLNTSEAIEESGSRSRFYSNVKPHIRKHLFDAKRTPWYKQSDIQAIRDGRVIQRGRVKISGLSSNWTEQLRSQGYRAETQVREMIVTTLPDSAIYHFHLSPDGQYLKKSSISFADGTPICTWSSYYPLTYVDPEDIARIKAGESVDLVKRMKELHGIIVRKAIDKFGARSTTFEEMNLFQTPVDEPVILLWRPSYTSDRTLALYSDMVLLASWFEPEVEYPVHHWD